MALARLSVGIFSIMLSMTSLRVFLSSSSFSSGWVTVNFKITLKMTALGCSPFLLAGPGKRVGCLLRAGVSFISFDSPDTISIICLRI